MTQGSTLTSQRSVVRRESGLLVKSPSKHSVSDLGQVDASE
jgi:hypothetical protein